MRQESLDMCVERLAQGEVEALDDVFRAYEPYLRVVVRRRLSQQLRRRVDSQDIVQSVFADLVRGVEQKRWQFEGGAQLLSLMRQIASRRLIDRYREHGSSLHHETSANAPEMPEQVATPDPRPSQVAQGNELWEQMLGDCSPSHQEVLRLRREGYRLTEIAARTGLHEGSVRRILYELAQRMAATRDTNVLTRRES